MVCFVPTFKAVDSICKYESWKVKQKLLIAGLAESKQKESEGPGYSVYFRDPVSVRNKPVGCTVAVNILTSPTHGKVCFIP